MRIIISPAKKMNVETDSLPPRGLPLFLAETEEIKTAMQKMSAEELKNLWRCSDAIAELNLSRLQKMELKKSLTPAILAYEGIQYQTMAPNVFEQPQYAFVQEHLRILSGFYGLLRPFDGVTPYRLEMQAKLRVGGCRDLYEFWGAKLAEKLAEETSMVLNLASKEYSKAIKLHLTPKTRFITCIFGEKTGKKIIEKGTMCKMARGQMVRWLAENNITQPENFCCFEELNYQFSPEDSSKDNLVFLKK